MFTVESCTGKFFFRSKMFFFGTFFQRTSFVLRKLRILKNVYAGTKIKSLFIFVFVEILCMKNMLCRNCTNVLSHEQK